MAGPEYPIPASLKVQRSLGPSLGQDLRRPVSLETLSRLGPCHCGQSPARESKTTVNTRTVAQIEDFMRNQIRDNFYPGTFLDTASTVFATGVGSTADFGLLFPKSRPSHARMPRGFSSSASRSWAERNRFVSFWISVLSA